MKSRNEKETYSLTANGIDAFSDSLDHALEDLKIDRLSRLRIRLSLEEALLRFRDHFGEEKQFQFQISRRLGSPTLQIDLEGEIFNPLRTIDSDLYDWGSALLISGGMYPKYSYSGNHNILKLVLPVPGINPVLKILIAILVGVLAGFLARTAFPAAAESAAPFFEPVYSLWFRLLNLISGPVIFFMVVTTSIGIGKMSRKGTGGKLIVGRYFLITALIAFLAFGVVCLISKIHIFSGFLNENMLANVIDEIFNIIPADFLTPFISAETPQLILLGFCMGTILNLLRDQVSGLVSIVQQINTACLVMAEWISWLVPIFTLLFLGLEIINGQFQLLVDIWHPLLISIIFASVIAAIVLLYTAARKKTPVRVLLSKVWPPFVKAVMSGSLNASYSLTEKFCSKYMGIDHEFTEISLSHGLVLYMPANILGAVIYTAFAAARYEVRISWIWLFMAIILTAILMEAAPPVPGVSLLVYIAVFSQLGIPTEALMPAMIFDIIYGIFSTAVNQLMLQLEMVHQADRTGLLNRELLRTPLGKDNPDRFMFRTRKG